MRSKLAHSIAIGVGLTRPHHASVAPTSRFDQGGRPGYSRAVEPAIAHARLFESVVAELDVAVVVEDARGRVLASNAAAERILEPGCVPMHEDGWPLADEAHPAALALSRGRPCAGTSVEYRIRTREGDWRTVESIATNRLHDPAVLGIVVNTRDVTERRREQAALRATTSRLTNLVRNLKSGVLVEDEERRV